MDATPSSCNVRTISARRISIARVTPTTDMVSALSGGYGLWIAVGVAVLTMGFVLARVIEEI